MPPLAVEAQTANKRGGIDRRATGMQVLAWPANCNLRRHDAEKRDAFGLGVYGVAVDSSAVWFRARSGKRAPGSGSSCARCGIVGLFACEPGLNCIPLCFQENAVRAGLSDYRWKPPESCRIDGC
jgi:hypothetical protein